MNLLDINRDVKLLAPGFSDIFHTALDDCRKAGFTDVAIFEGWRSPERQAQCYAQGRTTPGKIITNARPFTSLHQYGIAADIAFYKDGAWSWDGPYESITPIFLKHGFDPPPDFEKAHFQITYGHSITRIREITETSTLMGLWLTLGLI